MEKFPCGQISGGTLRQLRWCWSSSHWCDSWKCHLPLWRVVLRAGAGICVALSFAMTVKCVMKTQVNQFCHTFGDGTAWLLLEEGFSSSQVAAIKIAPQKPWCEFTPIWDHRLKMFVLWLKQCHNPFGNGLYNLLIVMTCDDWGMVYGIVLTTLTFFWGDGTFCQQHFFQLPPLHHTVHWAQCSLPSPGNSAKSPGRATPVAQPMNDARLYTGWWWKIWKSVGMSIPNMLNKMV